MAFMADHHAYLNLMMHLADPHSGFDIVHNHSLHHLPVAMAPMLATPMITHTAHTPDKPWLESALDVTGSTGTRFAAVSEHTRRRLAPTSHPTWTVVPNGVDFPAVAARARWRQPGVVSDRIKPPKRGRTWRSLPRGEQDCRWFWPGRSATQPTSSGANRNRR